ncbi:hypothetical protein PC128_g25130 [Phytophthora cactorum]|nr:hypothetical protein PC128_g25130 [Phytophthora cactorum]
MERLDTRETRYRRVEPCGSHGRRERREPDRRRDDYRNTRRVPLTDTLMNDLIADLQDREAVTEPSDNEYHAYDDVQYEYDREQGYNQDRRGGERGFNQDRRSGERGFNQDRRGGDRGFSQDSCGRRDFNRDNRRPQYGPCSAYDGMSHSAHNCNKRCMFCKQVHDAGQCELFHNFQGFAKFVRTRGTKEELPSELKSVVQEGHLN